MVEAEPQRDVIERYGGEDASSEDEALADMRALDEDVEALGAAWDSLSQKARDTICEHARACDAAVALVEEYRTPPRHCHALQTCWRRERDSLGPVLCVPSSAATKKPCLRPSFIFEEVDVQGTPLEPRRRAQLIVCSERQVFDEQTLRFYAANRAAGFSFTMILHTGGKVASEVTQQNILREPRGAAAEGGRDVPPQIKRAKSEDKPQCSSGTATARADAGGLAPRIEVHAHTSIILHGTHAEESDYRIVPASEALRVQELYGIEDVALLPAVDATSREVMLTGALERDMVQAVEPQGIALVFVTPLADAGGDYEYERLMRELEEQPQLMRRREDLAREAKNAVAAECARLLEEANAAKAPGALERWAALERWVDSKEFVEARGCPRRSREVFASLQTCAPELHERISALLERGDPEGEAWGDDLLLSALYRGVYAARDGRAVAAAVYCHSRLPVENEEEEDDESDDGSAASSFAQPHPQSVVEEEEDAASLGATPSPRSLASSSDAQVPPDSDSDLASVPGEGMELANLEALLAAESDEGAEEDEDVARLPPRLEVLRARELAFVAALRERIYGAGVRLYREDFLSMHFHVDEWYAALESKPSLERHVFWEWCRSMGLSAVLASTLQQLHTGVEEGLTLREEIGAVEHWLQQGSRIAPSREAARATH